MTLYLSFPRLKYSSMKTNPISRCKITKFTGNLKATCAGIDLNLFFTRSSLVIEGWDDTSEDGATTLYTRCQDPSGVCPYCGHESEKIHSRYTRHLQDLPAFGKRIRLCFEARRFFCRNESCGRRRSPNSRATRSSATDAGPDAARWLCTGMASVCPPSSRPCF